MKNKARLPRTAGLRTITDLTTDLTNAGLDPSRVQERATMIAKMRGASSRKRRRDEDGDGMDVDVDGDDDDDDDGAALEQDGGEGADAVMDVDDGEWEDEDDTPRKRGKANSGAAFARKRAPQSNRQLAGMRDEAVRSGGLLSAAKY
jgi:nucleolar GTP-binding protein